jgi:DNA-binding GntR family transcriptional regulator
MRQGEKVYSKLRRLVIEKYEPGTPLGEQSLARDFGTSRSPVREALLRLRAEGFVEKIQHRGYSVARITVKQLQDTFEVRRLLEGETASRAAQFAAPFEIQKMRKLSPYRMEIAKPNGYKKAAERNSRFHLSVAEASRNTYMAGLLEDCLAKMDRFLSLGAQLPEYDRKATNEEHLALVDAIEKRDSAKARRIIEHHLDRTMGLMMDELRRREVGVTA